MSDTQSAQHIPLFARLIERTKGRPADPEPVTSHAIDTYRNQARFEQEREKL